jgi:hypothetical protein
VLLDQIGLSPEVQRRVVGLPYLYFIVREFNKALADI